MPTIKRIFLITHKKSVFHAVINLFTFSMDFIANWVHWFNPTTFTFNIFFQSDTDPEILILVSFYRLLSQILLLLDNIEVPMLTLPSKRQSLVEKPAFGMQISTFRNEGLFSIHRNNLLTSSSLPTSH